MLWQTDTISPANEHFISYLIRQKIISNSEKLQFSEPKNQDKVFVLSLPLNEIHELGLMYLHYEILLKGYKSIYLGESMPIKNLKDLKKHFNSIVYVSCLTVQPDRDEVNTYVQEMVEELLDDSTELWYIGRLVSLINSEELLKKVSVFNSIPELTSTI